VLDTTLPVIGNAAQRPHGEISNDGPKNLVDSVEYISSRIWQDEAGRNKAGMVVIQEQQIFASREVQKGDARPGGCITTGGHGGLLGAVRGHGLPPILTYLPGAKHSWQSGIGICFSTPSSVPRILTPDPPREKPFETSASSLAPPPRTASGILPGTRPGNPATPIPDTPQPGTHTLESDDEFTTPLRVRIAREAPAPSCPRLAASNAAESCPPPRDR